MIKKDLNGIIFGLSLANDNGNWTRLCFGLLYELVQLYGIYLEWFSGKQQWINWTMVWNILWTGAFVVILKKSKMDIIKWNGEAVCKTVCHRTLCGKVLLSKVSSRSEKWG